MTLLPSLPVTRPRGRMYFDIQVWVSWQTSMSSASVDGCDVALQVGSNPGLLHSTVRL